MPHSSTTDWRSLDQAQLDAGLNNNAAVAGAGAMVDGWEALSAEMRARHPQHLNLRYGPRERNRVDFLKAADHAPTLVLIHGGYWQMRSKETFTHFASGPMAWGINVAPIGYSLAPDATLDEIVQEIHAGISVLADQMPALGGDPERIVVSGWSAGGHLAAMALSHPRIKGAVAISGIFDLEPVRRSYLNAKLKLDESISLRNSPMNEHDGADKPLALVVGASELPMLRDQTANYAAHRARHRLPVTYEEIRGADHFSIMEHLASPAGRITTLIRQIVDCIGDQRTIVASDGFD